MELQGNNFGERLLEARKAKKLTREKLAGLANISSKTIANYESGNDIQLLISLQDWLLHLMYLLQVCLVKRAK